MHKGKQSLHGLRFNLKPLEEINATWIDWRDFGPIPIPSLTRILNPQPQKTAMCDVIAWLSAHYVALAQLPDRKTTNSSNATRQN